MIDFHWLNTPRQLLSYGSLQALYLKNQSNNNHPLLSELPMKMGLP